MAMEDSTNVNTPNTETPPQPHPISFSANGTLKRHHHAAAPVVLFYKECLKNHAAGIGGMALDGCGEFMPAAAATNADPTSLKCAACGCHRNFHRREIEDRNFISFHRLPPPLNLSLTPSPSGSPGLSTPPTAATPHSSFPHMLLALNPKKSKNPSLRKRFRTKFSHTQKQKMQCFAEKLGWKLQKSHESLVEEFCKEIGVSRGVLKVWMHNNKHRDHQIGNNNTNNNDQNGNNSRGSFDTDNENHHNEANSALLHCSSSSS